MNKKIKNFFKKHKKIIISIVCILVIVCICDEIRVRNIRKKMEYMYCTSKNVPIEMYLHRLPNKDVSSYELYPFNDLSIEEKQRKCKEAKEKNSSAICTSNGIIKEKAEQHDFYTTLNLYKAITYKCEYSDKNTFEKIANATDEQELFKED